MSKIRAIIKRPDPEHWWLNPKGEQIDGQINIFTMDYMTKDGILIEGK